MKGKLACVLVITMFILMAVPATSANVDAEYEKELPSNAEVKFTDRSVAVLSDSSVGNSISSALSQSTSKLNVMDSISVANAKDITIIDSAWAATKEADVINNGVKTLIESNKAVILLDDSPDLIKQSGADLNLVGFLKDAQAYGIINTTSGQTYCYSVGGYDDIQEAMVLAYNWADEIIEKTSSSIIDYPWGNETMIRCQQYCDDYGVMDCSTAYFKLDDNLEGNKDTYLVRYNFYAIPNSEHSKSGMDVYSKINGDSQYGQYQSLISTSPESTSTNSYVGVGLDPGISGIDAYVSWTYEINDVNISNNSSINNNILDIKHDINECKNVGYGGYAVYPGALISVVGSNGYHGEDLYTTEFCDVVISGLWHNNFKSYTMTVDVDTI